MTESSGPASALYRAVGKQFSGKQPRVEHIQKRNKGVTTTELHAAWSLSLSLSLALSLSLSLFISFSFARSHFHSKPKGFCLDDWNRHSRGCLMSWVP